MDRSRLEFLKKVARHFQENPQAKDYLGVSKETCFSTLGLYFSSPENILDHTDPDFLNDLNERAGLVEGKIARNQPPETVPLPGNFEKRVREWQEAMGQKVSPTDLEKAGQKLEGKLEEGAQAAWAGIDQKITLKMSQTRLGPFKEIVSHFQKNPQAKEYLGLSRETCFSTLGLYLSSKEEILDPTDPEFLKKAGAKVDLCEQKIAQNQPLHQTQPLPVDLDRTFRQWQGEIKKLEAVGKTEGLGEEVLQKKRRQINQRFEPHLQNRSLQGWKKIAPKLAPKMEWFLKSGLQKAAGVVGFGLMATFLSLEVIKKAVKILAPVLYLMYNFFAAIGGAVFAGAIYGGVAGALAGGVGGAILGAKLGAAIGFAVGGPVGAVIGAVLGGITGFIVGALAGTAVGMAIGAAVGYAWEHWVWQPLQNFWVGAGNVLGGVGSAIGGFLGGAGSFFGGILGATGSAIGAGLSLVGGAVEATGGFIASLGGQLAGLSITPSVIIPVGGALGAAAAGTYLGALTISTAFVPSPPQQGGIPPPQSQYITVAKNGTFPGLGNPISYTLTLTAKGKRLENVQIVDETTFNCAGTPPSVPRKTLGPIAFINPNQTSTLNYSTDTNHQSQFNNCAVTNTATATFNVPEEGKTGQTASVSFSVTIGSPPAPSCPIPGGTITCGSWQSSNPICRHCKPGYYAYSGDCGLCAQTGTCDRATAIDVVGPSGGAEYDVYLPIISGQSLTWKFTAEVQASNTYDWGYCKFFTTAAPAPNDKNYDLKMCHLERGNPTLNITSVYRSGEPVGNLYRMDGPHVHATVAENGIWQPADIYFGMCV